MKPIWYKTNQKEVFDYIVRYERFHLDRTGKAGIYPTQGIIAFVFEISWTRADQYKRMFNKKLNQLKK